MKGKIIWPEVSSTVSLTIPDLSGEYSNDFSGQDAYQGGLICQSIVGFHGRARKLLIDDITSLTSDELSEIFEAPVSHINTKFFGIPRIEPRFLQVAERVWARTWH